MIIIYNCIFFFWLSFIIFICTGPGNFTSNALNLPIKVFYDSSNGMHRDRQYHPEQSARISACVSAISNYMESSSSAAQAIEIIDVAASDEGKPEIGTHSKISKGFFSDQNLSNARSALVEIHSEELVSRIERKCRSSRERRIEEGKDALGFIGYLDEGDTYVTTESYDVCLRATACWMECVDRVLSIRDECRYAMALTRPPGHHSTRSLPNGFCIFNFAAAAAVHAIKTCQKVTILDWDVHYGQGVADIIEDYENIRYVSMHQYPAFPYQGEKRGARGEFQNIMTVPLAVDSSWTCGFESPFTSKVLPFCSSSEWQPDLVIVCAGYDALSSDELASCNLVAEDYGKMTRLLIQHLGEDTKIIFGLEGGYQLQDGAPGGNLCDAVVETIKALQ